MFGIPAGTFVWGKQYHNQAQASLGGQTPQPSAYNANYIKPIGGSSVPLPIPGEQPLPIRGSDVFNGVAATGYINDPYAPASYNANYLKPTFFGKTPVPEPYSLSKALALATAQATPLDDAQAEPKPVDLLTTVKNLFEAASSPAEKAMWQQHMNGLERLNAISSFRAFTSEENQRFQKIRSDIEQQAAQLTPAAVPAVPAPTAAEIAAQIAAVLPANPTAQDIANAIASVLPGANPSLASTMLAPTVVMGQPQPQPGLPVLTLSELQQIEAGQAHHSYEYSVKAPLWINIAGRLGHSVTDKPSAVQLVMAQANNSNVQDFLRAIYDKHIDSTSDVSALGAYFP
jgi:hypothetical protein